MRPSEYIRTMGWDSHFVLKTLMVAILFFLMYFFAAWASFNFGSRFDASLAALPLVFGMLWGFSSFFGIIIGGIFLSPIMTDDPSIAIPYILIYALVALCSYRCFHAMKKANSNDYIYDARGMLSFFLTTLVMAIMLYASLKFVFIGENAMYLGTISVIVFNTIWVSLLFGIVILILVSIFYRAPSMPHHEQTERWRYVLFSLFIIPVVFLLCFDSIPNDMNWAVLTVDIIILAIVGFLGPSQPVKYNAEEFHSLKFKSFVMIFAVALVLSISIDLVLECLVINANFDESDVIDDLLIFRAFTISIVMLAFISIAYIIETKVTAPIYDITSKIRRDGEMGHNEFDVISNRLDFIAGNKEGISGNEFCLYIGLTKHDGTAQFGVDEAKGIIDGICLRYVSGYLSEEGKGGYKGEKNSMTENVLVYKIFGATDNQINNILDDVLRELEQESILVEKNGVSRWYYYGK